MKTEYHRSCWHKSVSLTCLLGAGLLFAGSAPVLADPPDHAPAHGYRRNKDTDRDNRARNNHNANRRNHRTRYNQNGRSDKSPIRYNHNTQAEWNTTHRGVGKESNPPSNINGTSRNSNGHDHNPNHRKRP